jgi:hypothetical protein
MDSICIFFPRVISVEELSQFVVSRGGEWQDSEPDFRQGFVGDEEAGVFICGVDTQEEHLIAVPWNERLKAARRLGRPVVAVLTIDHTKGDHGEKLAGAVASEMEKRWTGAAFTYY